VLLQVLTGSVASCEDHGYVIDIGVKGINAFLSTAEADKYTAAYGDGLFFVVDARVIIQCHSGLVVILCLTVVHEI